MRSFSIPLWVILLFAAIVSSTAEAAVVSSCPIRDVSASSSALWLLCADGRIAVTDDGGATWSEREIPVQEALRGVESLDSQRAFVVGDRGTLLATDDAGRTWTQASVPTDENLTSVSFLGESGWVTGWGGVMLHSPDGGLTWERQPTHLSQALEQVHFTDLDHGWAVGWVGVIIRTVDGGKTWQQVRDPAALWSLSSVYFRDPQEGWAVGFMGQILRSRDGGQTWEKQTSPVQRWLMSVFFDNGGRGWIAAEDGVLVSDDGGDSWQYNQIEDRLSLTKLTCFDGYLIGASPRGLLQLSDADSILKTPRLVYVFGTGGSELIGDAQPEESTD
jgi:photosystem II stability/assembly factor-like uncharacterized protein